MAWHSNPNITNARATAKQDRALWTGQVRELLLTGELAGGGSRLLPYQVPATNAIQNRLEAPLTPGTGFAYPRTGCASVWCGGGKTYISPLLASMQSGRTAFLCQKRDVLLKLSPTHVDP